MAFYWKFCFHLRRLLGGRGGRGGRGEGGKGGRGGKGEGGKGVNFGGVQSGKYGNSATFLYWVFVSSNRMWTKRHCFPFKYHFILQKFSLWFASIYWKHCNITWCLCAWRNKTKQKNCNFTSFSSNVVQTPLIVATADWHGPVSRKAW